MGYNYGVCDESDDYDGAYGYLDCGNNVRTTPCYGGDYNYGCGTYLYADCEGEDQGTSEYTAHVTDTDTDIHAEESTTATTVTDTSETTDTHHHHAETTSTCTTTESVTKVTITTVP